MNITALCIASLNKKGEILEIFFNWLTDKPEVYEKISKKYNEKGNFQVRIDKNFNDNTLNSFLPTDSLYKKQLFKNQAFIMVALTDDKPIKTVPEAYIKLYLLSRRLFKPGTINLDNIFNVLPNVVWSNLGAVDINEIDSYQIHARIRGEVLHVKSVDKFPLMTDYIIPSKVRIANTARVRLGAYLGEGTTVMHEGFVNFNAGTEGPNMVEGRISAGVFVEAGTDLGGSCSIMGTLSGGNDKVIKIGKNCLIGANSGVGISLGDNCIIEAGFYVTAGTKVRLLDKDKKEIKQVKALDLSGQPNLLFRRNSITGSAECIMGKNTFKLNQILHNN